MPARAVLLAWLLVGALATSVAAVDQPISGVALQMQRSTSGRELLSFSSKDALALFPAVGGSDDPATAGLVVELFNPHQPTVTFTVLPGSGSPGWTSKPGPPGAHKYRDKLAGGATPVATVQLKEGKQVKLTVRAVGLDLTPPTGPVGIRITTGSLRSCALFTAATITKDATNHYKARGAVAADLHDCAEASLGAYVPSGCESGLFGVDQCGGECPAGSECGTQDLSSCICIDAAQPCGDTDPVCNGQCPSGEACVALGGFPLPGCGCLPTGSTPCGSGQCGGDCPAGEECNLFQIESYFDCSCGQPGPCGGGGDDCPPGTHCVISHFGTGCFP